MTKPFASDPHLSSHFPSSDELKRILANAPRTSREVVARLWLTEGIPSAFLASPAVYEDLRGWLASRLSVHPKEVTLIGSARIGYSLAPPPDYGRLFGTKSDLDLSIVSGNLFQLIVAAFEQFSADYKSGTVTPANNTERSFWDENLRFGARNIDKGFFDPNKIPNRDRYPVVQRVSQSMWMLVERLKVTPNAPHVRRASTRIYRDWQSLIERLSLNLSAVLKKV